MSQLPKSSVCRGRYELRFSSLFSGGQDLTFPCDAQGQVEIGRLSERSRNNYLYARAVIGREFLAPSWGLLVE
jgi:hypothetical protein